MKLNFTEKKQTFFMTALFLLLMMITMGYIDYYQIQATYITQEWELYNKFIAPAFQTSWYLLIITGCGIYFEFTKDVKETLALVLSSFLLLQFGFEDLIFFIWYQGEMAQCMDWMHITKKIGAYAINGGCVTIPTLAFNIVLLSPIIGALYFWSHNGKK